ncbi:MAG: hypothetical protein J1E38_09445 [Paramuribaculum sp.]|nr:hypothetical protein [Paramuribaculum sp.]
MQRILTSFFSLILIVFFNLTGEAKSKRVYRDDIGHLTDSTIFLINSEPKERNTVEVCFSFPGKNEGVFAQKRKLSLIWNYQSDDNFYSATFGQESENMDDMVDTRYVQLIIQQIHSGKSKELAKLRLKDNVGLGPEENVAMISLTDQTAEIGVGHRKPTVIWRGELANDLTSPIAIRADGNVSVSEIVEEHNVDIKRELITDLSETIIAASASKDKHVGIWLPLDRNMDDAFAKAGGRYRLGLIEDPQKTGDYLIIYLSGAEVNSTGWKEGMIKGRLKATPFKNHFDLVWYDSKMEKIDRDCHADISEESILTLHFPLMKSSMRFYKE